MTNRNFDIKNVSLDYFMDDPQNINPTELIEFLREMDKSFIDPLVNRSYFQSYNALAKKFLNHGKLIYCKDKKGRLVGLAVIYADNTSFDLAFESYIGVLKEFNGLGIARELMKYEIAICQNIGMKGILTNCHRDNERKIRLNIKIGFKEIISKKEIDVLIKMNNKWQEKRFFKIEFE